MAGDADRADPVGPHAGRAEALCPGVWDPDEDPVELYYLPDDFTQAHDLAAEHPEKVQELKDLFWAGGREVQGAAAAGAARRRSSACAAAARGTKHEFRGDVQNVLSGMIPRIYNHSYSISADLVIPAGGAEGVIVAEADHLGGFSLFVDDGKLTHTYSMMGVFVFRQQGRGATARGRGERADGVRRRRRQAGHRRRGHAVHRRRARRQRPDGPHRPDPVLRLRRHGHRPRQRRRRRLSYEDRKPFAFTGTIKKVVFDVEPHLARTTSTSSTPPSTRGTPPTHSPLTAQHRKVTR